MYWIYFIIFTLIVFIPSIVSKGIWGFSVVQTQEYAILFLGILGFALFTLLEKRIKKNEQEKVKMIGQINRTTRDLTHSYSYIGEMNRKLDILKNITLGFPESSHLATQRQKELYASIMDAIKMLEKLDDFVLRFVDVSTGEILKEIKSKRRVSINFDQKDCDPQMHIFENDNLIFIPSPKTIDNVYSCIILKKKNSQRNVSDPEIMKMLAMQALSLFMFVNKKESDQQQCP